MTIRRRSTRPAAHGTNPRVVAGIASLIVAVASVAVAQDFDAVKIETIPLGGGLFMLVGAGGNIGLSVGSDGAFLIDDQYAPLTPKIRAAVAAAGAETIRFVVNTHWHGDHTGGNEALAGTGALIVAHENVRRRMSSEQFIAAMDRRVPPSPAAALPVVTFADSVTLHVNGHTVHAFHVDPAHTDGDAIIHIEDANVIHMGDTYFNRMYPFFDLSSGGRFEGMLAAVDRGLALADVDTKIIPGHGPLSNRSELEQYRAMLIAVRDAVAAAIADGKSQGEVIASRPTAAFDAAHASGFLKPEQFVGLVFQSLSKDRSPSPDGAPAPGR